MDMPRSLPFPLEVHLKGIKIVGELGGTNRRRRTEEHFVIISVDGEKRLKSERKYIDPVPKWEWNLEDGRFLLHPSSTINIQVFRLGTANLRKHLVGVQEFKAAEIINAPDDVVNLKDKSGNVIATKMKVDLVLLSEPDSALQDIINQTNEHVTRLDNPHKASCLQALGTAFRITRIIMDAVGSVHPIVKASWIVVSAAYTVIEHATEVDSKVSELAKALAELLGTANKYPTSWSDVADARSILEDIGRTSVKVTTFIYEYAMSGRLGRLKPGVETRLKELLSSCRDLQSELDRRFTVGGANALVEIGRNFNILKDNQLAKEIRAWLSAPDTSPNYHDACKKRQQNTCQWFLDGPAFHEFMHQKNGTWLNGKTGCGKTILCSAIIAKIIELVAAEKELSAYGYFFFDGSSGQKEQQTHDMLIRSLISQLCYYYNGVPAVLVELYQNSHQRQPSILSLEAALGSIMDGIPSIYIVIDSLDECDIFERENETMPWIKRLSQRVRKNVHFIISSRPEPDIKSMFASSGMHTVSLEQQVTRDIEAYIDQQLLELSPKKKWTRELVDEIRSALVRGADGTFRWVSLQLLALRRCSSAHEVSVQLKNLPKDLYATYDRMLENIELHNDGSATTMFMRFLCFSARAMKLAEVAEAVTVIFEADSLPRFESSRRYTNPEDVLEKCSGFIVRSIEDTVRLAHFSVKEYFLSDHLYKFLPSFHLSEERVAHSVISQTCLAYLSQFETVELQVLSSYPRELQPPDMEVLSSFPLATYAAQFWFQHAKSSDIGLSEMSCTFKMAKALFTNTVTFSKWVCIYDIDYNPGNLDPQPLYYAIIAKVDPLVRYFVDLKSTDVNKQTGGRYGPALTAAAHVGLHQMVALLLDKGADPNLQGGYNGTALQTAALEGHLDIVKILLSKDADPNLQGGHYGTALQATAWYGHLDIVNVLLRKGADPNLKGGEYGTALQAAASRGHLDIIKTLLSKGANPDLEGGRYGTALQAAALGGHLDIIHILLSVGADPNLQSGKYGTALQGAASAGHLDIVNILLSKGADPNLQGGADGTALYAAASEGRLDIVEILLSSGAYPNLQDGLCGTALQAAAWYGHLNVVKFLLSKGADRNLQDGQYGTALHAAEFWGHSDVIKVLREWRDPRDGDHQNASSVP